MPRRGSIPNPYDRFRVQAYDAVLARQQDRSDDIIFDVKTELLRLGTAIDLDGLKDAAATKAAETEDGLRTSPPPKVRLQPPLPGWPDPEDRVWKLGEGSRVVVRSATAEDHLRHLQLAEENARQVEDARRETAGAYYRLAPYYTAGARTVEEAAARWQHDHGGGGVAGGSRPII